ncbi:hypothetical protein [Streptomyces sp. NPDC001530]|uniref:hypothetical protein n=1 Tax=Streptomyces sp. NPDC001530 TaxID=3364582 RepID=UPI0036875A6C
MSDELPSPDMSLALDAPQNSAIVSEWLQIKSANGPKPSNQGRKPQPSAGGVRAAPGPLSTATALIDSRARPHPATPSRILTLQGI